MSNDEINEKLLDENLKGIKPKTKDEALALLNKKKKQHLLKDRKPITTFPKAK